MDRARIHEGIRLMRFEALLERQERGELSQVEAAEVLGISERVNRRRNGTPDRRAKGTPLRLGLKCIGAATAEP